MRNYRPNCARAITICSRGWSSGTFDAEHPDPFLGGDTRRRARHMNFGGYSNARVDELLLPIQQELDVNSGRPCSTRSRRSCRTRSLMCPLHRAAGLGGTRRDRPCAAPRQLLHAAVGHREPNGFFRPATFQALFACAIPVHATCAGSNHAERGREASRAQAYFARPLPLAWLLLLVG